jgi:peptidoglycan/LPS O-acetylase OafA/YrhL
MKATTAPALPDSWHHIASLDGVRGLAISLVLMEHLLWANPDTGYRVLDFVSKIRSSGWVGVDLFFALSGFLITGILFDTLHSKHYFKNFYARRMLRIFPLYYAVLLILFVALHPRSFEQARPFVRLVFYLQNTPVWWSPLMPAATIGLTNHLWSLAVEEQFYLVWPVIIFFVRDRRWLLWVALLLASVAPITRAILLAQGGSFGSTYTLTFCRADSLLCGAWLALVMRGDSQSKVLRFAAPVFAVSFAGCLAIAWTGGGFDWLVSPAINLYGYSVIAIASTAFIAMSLKPRSLLAKAMNNGILRSLGKYSYGIYILHHIVSLCAEVTILSFLRTRLESRVLYHLLSAMIVLSVTLLLAWLSYNFYERRFLQLKRYFRYSAPQPQSELTASIS